MKKLFDGLFIAFLIFSAWLCVVHLAHGQSFDDRPITSLEPVEYDVHAIRDKYANSICRVSSGPYPTRDERGRLVQGWSVGSGCFIGNRWILSASHVTRVDEIEVSFASGEKIQAQLHWKDRYADSALILLEKDPDGVIPVPIANSEPTGKVVLCGFDSGDVHRLRFFAGEVGRTGSDNRGRKILWFYPSNSDVAVSGNSGGPVFNSRGQLVCNLASVAENGSGTTGHPNSIFVDFLRRVGDKYRTEEQQQIIYDWGNRYRQPPACEDGQCQNPPAPQPSPGPSPNSPPSPSQPPSPQPACDPCECDNEALKSELESMIKSVNNATRNELVALIESSNGALRNELVALIELNAQDVKNEIIAYFESKFPPSKGISHLVIVADPTASYWSTLEYMVRQARDTIQIHVATPPPNPGVLPKLVPYSDGKPQGVITGYEAVYNALDQIYRGDSSLLRS